LNSAGDEFYCAFNWYEDDYPWDHDIPLEGCTSDGYLTYMDGDDYNSPDGYHVNVGALIVKAGCTFYGYSDYHYNGDRVEYKGPATFPNGCSGSMEIGNCPPIPCNEGIHRWGYNSMRCRCQQDPIICQPSDHYVTIMQCDNSNHGLETICKYTKTIGTTWTTEVSESMSIDEHIEASMSASFFSFFSTEIGVSITTGYDWGHTSSQAKSETETFFVEAVVAPNSILIIDGAEGECGGNNVKTELFRFTSTDREGNIISQTFENMNGNNTIKFSN